MAFDLLPGLQPREWRSTICVLLCRKWEYRGGTDDGPIQHVDLVLIDEKVPFTNCSLLISAYISFFFDYGITSMWF